MSARLVIARHGNTFESHELPRRIGISDLPLAESGILQARALGVYLQKNQLIPDIVFSAELMRTKSTAKIIVELLQLDISIKINPMFNEIDYGVDENKLETEVVARIGRKALLAWEREAKAPHGWKVDPAIIIYNWRIFAIDLLNYYRNKTILVITSNGIARFAPYLTADFAAFSAQHEIKIATGALCVFESSIQAGVWDCTRWNIKPDLVC